MITIEEKNYLIDSCFGSGYIINSKYIKEYNNFYFCIEPSKMILFNYPKDDNYQLLENKIDYETFYNTSKFYTNYFNFHIKNNFKQSNYICKGIKNFQIKYPNNNSIKFKFNLLKEDEKTNKFEEYGFKYEYSTSYSNLDPLIRKIYSFSQIEYGKNKFQVFAKKSDDKIDYILILEELFIFQEESELNYSLIENKFENEIRPNERLFTEEEIKKYHIEKDYGGDIYLFEPNNNIVTLNDKIEYTLTVDEKYVTKDTKLIVEPLYIKDGQKISKRGIGYYEKIDKNKFNIVAKFMKKGLYEIEVSIGEEILLKIKIFRVLCKHDFSKEIRYERSKYLGGEGYTDEEIELLKEKGNEKIDNIILKAPKREESNLDEFTEYLKKNTNDLNDLEKAFLLFKWITYNIDYDKIGLLNKTCVYNKYEVFKTGSTVCEGYAKLFQHFADNINLINENICCFSKGSGYDPNKMNKKLDSDHMYNAVKLKNKWYLIDSTWGAKYQK